MLLQFAIESVVSKSSIQVACWVSLSLLLILVQNQTSCSWQLEFDFAPISPKLEKGEILKNKLCETVFGQLRKDLATSPSLAWYEWEELQK